jgi:hypothetical protein
VEKTPRYQVSNTPKKVTNAKPLILSNESEIKKMRHIYHDLVKLRSKEKMPREKSENFI